MSIMRWFVALGTVTEALRTLLNLMSDLLKMLMLMLILESYVIYVCSSQ